MDEAEQRLFNQNDIKDLEWLNLTKSAQTLEAFCRTSTVRMVKTVRMLGYVSHDLPTSLLDKGVHFVGDYDQSSLVLVGLKIIHLIRHPTDVARSYQNFQKQNRWNMTHQDATEMATQFCSRMITETNLWDQIEKKYPG